MSRTGRLPLIHCTGSLHLPAAGTWSQSQLDVGRATMPQPLAAPGSLAACSTSPGSGTLTGPWSLLASPQPSAGSSWASAPWGWFPSH